MTYYIIIRGPLGIGKSTISQQLAKRLGAQHISVDRILDEYHLTDDREEGYISQKSFFRANEIAAEKARELLESEIPVVFDGNFYWKSQVEDLVKRLPYQHHVFTLKAPIDVCIARDASRSKTHGKDAARAVYAKSTSFDYGIVIETQHKSVEETVSAVLLHSHLQ